VSIIGSRCAARYPHAMYLQVKTDPVAIEVSYLRNYLGLYLRNYSSLTAGTGLTC
jgi:hypothetical protein